LGHRYRAFARCSECRCLVRMPDRTVSHTLKEVIQPHLPIRLPSNADLRLLAIPTSWSRVADSNPDWDGVSGIGSPSPACSPLSPPL